MWTLSEPGLNASFTFYGLDQNNQNKCKVKNIKKIFKETFSTKEPFV